MSADNWDVCPKCLAKSKEVLEVERKKLADMYGKVPVDDYLYYRAKVEELEKRRPENTLREDYEIGIDQHDGRFFVVYAGSCRTCGFSFEYRHEEQAYKPQGVSDAK